ncbi:hypothetical protein WMY93_011416 [Mugilogobius chulae]|uniref:Uncharacterized protein n=1 Tax=Mugilogobius chulae TaxID=88201 RepID=A0AAW0P2S9_9GOBI
MDDEYYSSGGGGGGGGGGGVGGGADWEGPDGGMEDGYVDDSKIQDACLEKFSSRDYIMEPAIFNTLKMYFQAGGSPEHVIQLLSENYSAVAQTVNLLAEWLIQMDFAALQSFDPTAHYLLYQTDEQAGDIWGES